MATEIKKEIELEVAHVLFTDIVGYSKRPINEQRALIERLNEIVRGMDGFQAAETAGRLIKIPTGDGITLVFYQSPEAPVECALEISRALKKYPELRLRMGVHSGPVSGVIDVTGKANVAGAGINMAQRVMDCGDAGHILVSRHVAEDLEQYPHWQPYLHELGECEVKHGVRVSVTNLYTEELGNPAVPEKLKAARVALAAQRKRAALRRLSTGALGLLAAIAVIAFLFVRYAPRFAARTLAVPEKSIAVLPFENLSEQKASAFFADGVQDEILTDLAKVADLKVISRTSVTQYRSGLARNLREIGQQLGVAHVVEGSVQRAGNRVRVNAQLIDARTDRHLWGQTYDRDLSDIFAIQSEIAQAIADQLRAKISAGEKAAIAEHPTKDLVAYDFYVRAIALANAADTNRESGRDFFQQAVDLLNQAISRDPSFLLAYCKLAEVHDNLYFHGFDRTHGTRQLSLAKAAIDSAFRLKPDSADAHLALAEHLYRGYLDYDHARDELAAASRTMPNNARVFELSGYIDRRQGRWADAVRNFQRTVELDPQNAEHLVALRDTYRMTRAYQQARETADRRLALNPNGIGAQLSRAWIDVEERADTRPLHALTEKILRDDSASAGSRVRDLFVLALYERDFAAAERALAALTDPYFGEIKSGIDFNRTIGEAVIARAKGDVAAAQDAFGAARPEVEKVESEDPSHGGTHAVAGLVYAGCGLKEQALREGRLALELTPVTKNALDGPGVLYFFAVICAWTGERDLAFEKLETLATIPNGASYGDLRLDPLWDPLRGDPRFEKLVEEASQPVALK
jgi:TolB-like protein/class 3 adenylate cyclase/Tfp pilus assembly protein PilF